jgi:hypothetical protein
MFAKKDKNGRQTKRELRIESTGFLSKIIGDVCEIVPFPAPKNEFYSKMRNLIRKGSA